LIHMKELRPNLRRATPIALAAAITLCLAACHSPKQSQEYFATAASHDPMLELLHETALYSVYYDHALRRCVLHSTYTWGENGGGGGGTGIGVALFPCDPVRLKAKSEELRGMIQSGRVLAMPTVAPNEAAPAAPAPQGGETPAKATPPPGSYPGSAH
jgi:hypothetical protein